MFGGNYSWVQTFLTKAGNTYPAADKLIATAQYYGFDGWFFNQETEGGTAADAAAMRDLIRYIRVNSNLRISWYDSMTRLVISPGRTSSIRPTTGICGITIPMACRTAAEVPDRRLDLRRLFQWLDVSASAEFTRSDGRASSQPLQGLDELETEAEDFGASAAARIKMAKAFQR